MQTTLRIDDEIYRRAKAKAGEMGLSLTRFLEEAVEDRLQRLEARPARRTRLPTYGSGPPMTEEALREKMNRALLEEDLKGLHRDGPA